MSGDESRALVRDAGMGEVTLTPLPDPTLWGGPIRDERYLLVAS